MTSLDTLHDEPGTTRNGASAAASLEALFRRQAALTPEATALVPLASGGDGAAWSYRRLDRAAEQVARRLAGRGLGVGDRVALCLDRSPWLIAAILGTQRAGATYVPLDPAYPRQRLVFMLADSGAAALITEPGLRERLPRKLPAEPKRNLLLLDAGTNDDSGFVGTDEEAEPSTTGLSPDHLSHLIYTSGSTGTPKGVAIRHGGALAMIAWARDTFSAAERAGVLAATSVCFDLSVFEIFLPLTTGGTVLLARDVLQLTEGRVVTETLSAHPVTMINTVPTAITEVLRAGALPPTVRTVNLAGEALKRHLVERLYDLGHVERVYNLYGPSEDSTYSTWERVPRGEGLPVAIGRALPGSRAVVADSALRHAADGEAGELCLAGTGLARGYFGRPAKTAEAFVPDPFASDDGDGSAPGGRLYRTGDLARRLPDGRLEFLGRIDHQVKLRGFRIELGEIEEALLAHPGVRQVVAHVYQPAGGAGGEDPDPVLVAYWAGSADVGAGDVETSDLEAHLAERLPGYMIPGRWVRLDELPLTPNGKVDRKALPAPGQERPEMETAYREPEGETQRYLAALWEELLSLESVGADDDLFALGGHSLMATRINVRIRDELGVELPPEAPFLHRTVADLATQVDEHRAAGDEGGPARFHMPAARRYPRDSQDGHIPLGFPQQQIWVINQLRPDNLAYNFQYTVRFHGPLDRRVLERTLSEIVRRHESLRTTFPAIDGEPGQVVHEPWSVPVPLVDVSGLVEQPRRREEKRLIHLLVRRRFNVLELPLIIWPVVRLADDEHLFFQVEQHFVHDGWSIGLMLFEIEAIYPAFAEGKPSPLPELPVQYADFALWQRDWMRGEALDHQLDYWRDTMADPPPPLDLPSDRPRTPALRFAGRRLDVDVPPALYATLQEFGRRSGFTLFMLMTAAFEVLMHRYTGRTDFALGTALANRRQKEFEGLIGMIVNTLVLRADLSPAESGGAPTFLELLDRVRTSTLGLQAHQDLPFETLVAEVQPERDLSRNPLFQHMFSFHDALVPDLRFAGLQGELVERHNGSAKADLNVIVKPRASQRAGRAPSAEDGLLRVLWEYSTDLFDDATARRQWDHYLNLLQAVVEMPEAPVDQLPMMSAEERRQVLVDFNGLDGGVAEAPATGSPNLRLEALFAAQVERTPEAVAVAWPASGPGGATGAQAQTAPWTYRQLADTADGVARRLAARGLGPGQRVAICLDRTPLLLAAILGTLRAGATYVPLDPAYPAQRIAFMLADSGAAAVLTAAATEGALPSDEGDSDKGDGAPPRLLLDDAAETAAGAPSLPPLGAAPADALSHLIYTSGSTGTPKGVAIRHSSVVSMLDWAQATYPADERAGVLLSTSVCFDLSVFEIFLPLTTGGAVVLVRDALELAELPAAALAATPVTMVNTVPSAATELLRAGAVPTTVRTVNLAGEALKRDLVERLYGLGHVERVFNLYGPSEDTTYSTWEPVPRGAELPVTIGRPVPGSRAYVVDPRLRPTPVGVPGELCLAGRGIARGYLHRPARTARSFVPNPFASNSGDAGRRMYRTGDLARWRRDGRLDFLGRIDHQVKLRGYRIELGEIEEALLGHAAVGETVVVVHTASGSDPELVAYWAASDGSQPDPDQAAAELEKHLGASLPAYMVPKRWLLLDELPRTANGKVDRKALPDPGRRQRSDRGGEMVAPRNPTEATLAEVWAGVLGIDELGVEDGFFALGGHSLAGAKAMARSAAALGVDLTLPDLFEHPTVARIAALVERRRQAATAAGAPASSVAGGAAVPIPRAAGDRHAGLPASFDQQRLWFIDRLVERPSTYHIARAFRLGTSAGDLEVGALEAALDGLARRHEVLRTTFATQDAVAGDGGSGGVVQRVASMPVGGGRLLPLPLLDLAALGPEAAAAEEGRLLLTAAERPFDLAADPPLRGFLLRRGAGDHTLLLVLHHIATDGWSLPLLYRDLAELYRAAVRGAPADLPVLPIQYADFSTWQRNRLDSGRSGELETFWRQHLAGAPEVLELPFDRPAPALRSMRGGMVRHHLAADTVDRLRTVAQQCGATLFHALLAGWAALLGRLAGQDDVVVGSPVADRGHADLESLVGFFVNTLPLRLDLAAGDAGPASFAELIDRARATTLAAFAHRDLPFNRLVQAVVPDRNLTHSPLYQVTLAYQEGEEARLSLPGADVEAVTVERQSAHFALSLFVSASAAGGLDLTFRFERDLFDPATLQRWAGYLDRLLTRAAAEPQRPPASVALMGDEERRQIESWAAGGASTAMAPALAPAVLPQVLAAAAATPEAPAVVRGDEVLTYGELARRSAAMAQRLLALGIGAESVVGICLPPSPAQVVAALAVQRAGGAYLPLDPEHPADRLRHTLEDAGARLVLTSEPVAAARLSGFAGERLHVEAQDGTAKAGEPWDGDSRNGDGALDPSLDLAPAHPDQLAYVIYTSGTTGGAKGVGITHRGWDHLVAWHRDAYDVAAADRVSLIANPAFDAAVWELWPHLAAGASLHVPPAELRRDPPALYRWLAAEGITLAFVPTPVAEVMMEQPPPPGLALRTMLIGGDRLHRAAPRGLPFRIVNHYGPTEDSVVTTAGAVAPRADDIAPSQPPDIGRPIPGHQAHLLDPRLEPVPLGLRAEMWVAGVGLARGYLGRPGITADRFRPHPRPAAPGGRIFRTGDLCRWREDGRIDFLGRTDLQVKLRGFRIELGEIEAAVRSHPAVREAVVVVRGDAARAELVLYWVAAEGASIGGDDTEAPALQRYLAERLPAYMVPGRWQRLAALPLTASGKLDREALPDPGQRAGTSETAERVAPRNPAETTMTGIWSDILGVDDLGVHDGFFALGGHSLTGAKAASRCAAALGVELSLVDLFEHPTVARFAELAMRRRGEGTGSGAAPTLQRAAGDRHAGLPASYDQQRLWLNDRIIDRPSTYHIGPAFRFRGDLRVGALAAALDALARRHEVLRTTFEERETASGGPALVQRVTPVGSPTDPLVHLPVIDLAALPAATAGPLVDRLLRRGVEQPFDLSTDHPFRARLLRQGGDDHTLLLTLHHIAADGWSLPVVYRDLGELYRAKIQGDAPRLPALPVQYADFAAWQRRHVESGPSDRHIDYWRQRLQGAPELLELPTDRPRPATRSMRGGKVRHLLAADAADRLRDLAKQRETTLFTVLLAGWAALLGRLSGQTEVVIGSPVAGRRHAELEPLVGFFVNTLPLRVDLSSEAGGRGGFGDLVERARQVALSAYAHQDLPFERLVAAVAPRRTTTHSPLFQVSLAYHEGERPHLSLVGTRAESVPIELGQAHFEQTLFPAATADGGLELIFTYEQDLFDPATVRRMAGSLELLLAAGAAQPDRPLARLPLLSAAERQQVTRTWNDTAAWGDLPWEERPGDSLHRRFAEVADRAGDAVAVSEGDQRITYGELADRAGRLARRLRQLGVRPEDRIALTLPRSADRVVALLGILGAGAAYVPLDPTYPRERLALMLRDAEVRSLIAAPGTGGDGPNGSERSEAPGAPNLGNLPADELEVWTLDRLEEEAAAGGPAPLGDDPGTSLGPEQLAYILFTSGSTGNPKAVMIPHRGVLRLALGRGLGTPCGPGKTVLHFAPLAFDASTFELWGPLLNGGRVAVTPDGPTSLEMLAAMIRDEAVTTTFLTAGLFHQLVDQQLAALGVETLLTGGEVVSPARAASFVAAHPRSALTNIYGPTENTVFTCHQPVTEAMTASPDRPLPIGRPIAGSTLYVLDRYLDLVPPGVYGELCTGGDGLARGYAGHPARTAATFVPHPFAEDSALPGERLYRTGDKVRWLPDGRIDFLGRIDRQVKLRGFRIEPGEVEVALAAAPGVGNCTVLLRRDDADDPRLVAYLEPEHAGNGSSGSELQTADLRAFLAGRLPDFMVPGHFVVLDALPLTSNGKVDRDALPAPEHDRTDAGTPYEAPRNPTEERLATIWGELLGVDKVGIHDDFFALGGHSLLATRVITRVKQDFAVDLHLRRLFQAPTVAAFAAELATDLEGDSPTATAGPGPIQRMDRSARRRPAAVVAGRDDGNGGDDAV